MWSGKNILGVEQTGETGRVVVVDLSPVNQHETPDVSHGAWIMAKQVGVVLLILSSTMNLAPYV